MMSFSRNHITLHGLLKKIKNKKHKTTLLIITVLVIISLFFLLYQKRHDVYYSLGNAMFGGTVMSHTFYNVDMAKYFLMKANQKERPNIWTNYQLSRINFIQGNLDSALSYADKELEFYPNNCRTHYIRGLAYGYMDKLDEAISDFEIFNSCFPDTWAGHNDLAWFWFRKGDMGKVIEVVERTINKNNNAASPWLQNTYGTALMNVGRYKEAENALRMAKYLADNMTVDGWGEAYPGNDPDVYGRGLSSMQVSIQKNLDILYALMQKKK